MTITSFILVFLSLFLTDICWAFYVNMVKDGNALKSAVWSTTMFGIGAVGVIGYVTNPILLIPALLGAFTGTYVGVVLNKKKDDK